ncbi:MAG: hypothetical protein IKE43_11790 [Coriobacteriales bacterium]|nr:hypothetical protein [Coriobacteriales bacterium]
MKQNLDFFDYDNKLRDSVKKAYSCAKAPAGMKERIIDMARKEEGKHRQSSCTHRIPMRAVLVTALVAGSIGTVAFAATQNNFLTSAFGDKGLEDIEVHEVYYERKDTTLTAPGVQWAPVSEDVADELVGQEVQQANYTITHGDYTMTVEDVVMDENGLGVATITLSNPNGFEELWDTGVGTITFNPSITGVNVLSVQGAGRYPDIDTVHLIRSSRLVLDYNLSTETELHLVEYFAPFSQEVAKDAVAWRLAGTVITDGDLLNAERWEESTDPFIPQSYVQSVQLSTEDRSVSVSPLGIRFYGPMESTIYPSGLPTYDISTVERATAHYVDGNEQTVEAPFGAWGIYFDAPTAAVEYITTYFNDGTELITYGPGSDLYEPPIIWNVDKVIIDFADGSQYIVMDEYIHNYIFSASAEDDDGVIFSFNRLIDPEQIVSITVNGPQGEGDLVYTR